VHGYADTGSDIGCECNHEVAQCLPFETTLEAQLEGAMNSSECCGSAGLNWSNRLEEPLCRSRQIEQEAYRFCWRSSFDGDAVVHIGQSGVSTILRWTYRAFRVPTALEMPATRAISSADWEKLQQALDTTKF
jgi:hypothetical protein